MGQALLTSGIGERLLSEFEPVHFFVNPTDCARMTYKFEQ